MTTKLKHYIDMATNTYLIENDEGTIVFSINLGQHENIHIRAPKDVFYGKVEELEFVKKELE